MISHVSVDKKRMPLAVFLSFIDQFSSFTTVCRIFLECAHEARAPQT